jgi:hypothetical protein
MQQLRAEAFELGQKWPEEALGKGLGHFPP